MRILLGVLFMILMISIVLSAIPMPELEVADTQEQVTCSS